MYDTVIIEGLKLKQPKEITAYLKAAQAESLKDFQTKDLENGLSTYTIDGKGQIFYIEYKPTGKKVPYTPLFSGWTDNRSFIERIYFKLQNKQLHKKHPAPKFTQERKAVKIKSKLNETFNIYAYTEVAGRFVDVEYQIVAKDGRVNKTSVVKWSIESEKDATKRIKRDAEWKANVAKDIAKHKAFAQTWYYPILKETYNPFVFFAKIVVQKACQKLINVSYRWHGV